MIGNPSSQGRPSPGASSRMDAGRLSGLTILRFAHVCGEGGGMERYLLDLNRALGERNQLTTVQLELAYDRDQLMERTEVHNGCRLTKIPLLVEPVIATAEHQDSLATKWKAWVVNRVFCAWPVYEIFTRSYISRRRVPRSPGEPKGAGLKIREIIKRFGADLIVLHSSGGADASEIIEVARAENIPVALVHHFSNDRLTGLSLRQQISQVDGVAGVCAVDVPPYLRNRYCNLSDGIDTEFYRRENAGPLSKNYSHPILFLPARIIHSKGQADLIKIAAILKQRGIRTTVVFAGRIDSPSFEIELREMAAREGMAADVEFVGQLNPEQLRDWFAAAKVMVFPTYHHEGLPRILMECQDMGLPPVAYEIGGTSEGLLNKKTGFLIPLGGWESMAQVVETLLANESLRSNLGRVGRQFVEQKFSLRALAERHEDFYLKILPAHRRNSVAS